MTPSLRLFLALLVANVSSIAAIYDVHEGTFDAPDDFAFKHTGTIDSFMGTLTSKSSPLVISFDIGAMAGLRMSPMRKSECASFRMHTINGHFAYTGVQQIGGKRIISTSIFDGVELQRRRKEEGGAPLPRNLAGPANFWAEVTTDSDVAEFERIVGTYKVKKP